jgi:hypothetical protein
MTSEWEDLPTLQDVAAAQAAGEEIEIYSPSQGLWIYWEGVVWDSRHLYRSRPVPKVRKVKMLAWFTNHNQLVWYSEDEDTLAGWKRVPAQDLEIEVME